MDIFQTEPHNKKHSSLPPIKSSINQNWRPQETLSNKLQLYIKFRTSSKLTINSPIESLLPSSLSIRSNSIAAPTQADIVMSSRPPNLKLGKEDNFKYSRLFEIKQIKEKSFLQKSYKAQEHRNPVVKPSRQKRTGNLQGVKRLNRMRNENFSKGSIPFLSDILNRVCRQGSKIIFSPRGPLESNEVLTDLDRKIKYSEEEEEEEFGVNKFVDEDSQVFTTLDVGLQTEKQTEVLEKKNNKRRVIFNKNSSFRKKHSGGSEDESGSSGN